MTNNSLDSDISQLLNEDITVSHEKWSAPKKLITLFVLSYVFFYMFPYPLSEIPLITVIVSFYSKAIEYITLFLGRNVLGLTFEKIEVTGSGDTTFDYVSLITILILSLIVSVVVYIITRKQKNYSRLYNYIIVYARYYLALFLLSYGFAKVIGGQFSSPEFSQLEKTYGNSSPMNLLWTFMGYSKAYTMFSGFGEVLGGILLFFRRTTVMGCLVTIAIMLNVVMLNFSYDVPVKLFSCHLVLIALFIVSPYIKKLTDFFIFQRTSNLHFKKMQFTKKWVRVTRMTVKALIIISFPVYMVVESVQALNEYSEKSSINQRYLIQTFVRNESTSDNKAVSKKDTLLSNDPVKWNRVAFRKELITITPVSGNSMNYLYNMDSLKNKLTLTRADNSGVKYELDYKFPSDSQMILSGLYEGDSIYAVMKKKNLNDYLLLNRGFHWINEYPYNR